MFIDMGLFRKAVKPTVISVLDKIANESGISQTDKDYINAFREDAKRFNDIDKSTDEITGPDYRVMTIQDWLNAMRAADSPWSKSYNPNWVKLFDIFQNMIQDPHIQACIDTLSEGVQSKDFYIVDKDGERMDDITELFKSKWFSDYLDAVLNARLWGFSLIQLQDYNKSNNKLTTREVNRKHIRPDLGGIVKQQYDNTIFKSWEKEPFKTWTIFVYEGNLGKLNACVRWWIYKTEVVRFWAKYNQLFGIPPVIAKTSIKDRSRKENAITMLKKWLSTRYMVIDEADEIIPFTQSGSASGQEFFEKLIRLCDEQISKALLGSTMVLDNGSSRSQSEVHEDNTLRFIKSILRSVKFTTDDELIPRLSKIGLGIPEGSRLVWDNSEKLTMKERAEVVNVVNQSYKVAEAIAAEFIGIDLEEKEVQEFGFGNEKSLKDKLKEKDNGKD